MVLSTLCVSQGLVSCVYSQSCFCHVACVTVGRAGSLQVPTSVSMVQQIQGRQEQTEDITHGFDRACRHTCHDGCCVVQLLKNLEPYIQQGLQVVQQLKAEEIQNEEGLEAQIYNFK